MTGDPRLQRLLSHGFRCASCHELHKGISDLAFDAPVFWTGPKEKQPDEAVETALAQGRDVLTKNFCLLGEDRFVRAIIPFPIRDSDQSFAFGVWGTLSHAGFARHLDHFFGRDPDLPPPAFSWLANALPGAGPDPAKCRLICQAGGGRPVLVIDEADHPFLAAQTEGLSVHRLLDIYAAFGHDVRESTGDE